MQQNNFSERENEDSRFWRRLLRYVKGIARLIEEKAESEERKQAEQPGPQLNERDTVGKS